ncbi:MAG TPA: MAP7 domain-containing protein [Candidatus Baltobacteraceae bacterium]|jgi:hypothetical protein|nr:MAP7 domain-containing protein [Candidatus Baltobacteraceae bacterium]
MKKHVSRYIGLLLLPLGICAQPILITPQSHSFAGSSLSNLRVLRQSADGAEAILTVDFIYDGIHGPTARLLPVITDQKEPKVSSWFGANPVTISSGRGTISLKVRFFNDEPGVPPELSTDHIRVLMFSDGGNAVISQGIFSRTIKWGGPKAVIAAAPPPASRPTDSEARARDEARLRAEAVEKARQEAESRRLAEEKAEADAKAREEEAKRLAEEKAGAATTAQTAPAATAPFVISSKTRTKVTNIDVVNRNLDRTEITIAVEYQSGKADGPVRMGIDVASTDDPGVSDYFSCPATDIGKGNRNFVMFPVQFNVAAAQSVKRPAIQTDKVRVYLADASGQKSYIFQGTLMLVWHVPGAAQPDEPALAQSGGGNTLEIESFKQNDLFSGYVTVKYNLRAPEGLLRLRIFDSADPATASWFASDDVPIKSGPGLELVKIAVPSQAASPDVFNADTVEVQMLNSKGDVLATLRKQSPMSWAKRK